MLRHKLYGRVDRKKIIYVLFRNYVRSVQMVTDVGYGYDVMLLLG